MSKVIYQKTKDGVLYKFIGKKASLYLSENQGWVPSVAVRPFNYIATTITREQAKQQFPLAFKLKRKK